MKILLIAILFLPLITLGQKNKSVKAKTQIINQVFNSDSILILIKTSGCFSGSAYTYKFIKKQDSYLLTYYNSLTIAKTNNTKDSLNYHTKNISVDTFNEIEKLCLRGINLPDGLCTTRKKFIIKDKSNETFFNDDRCSDDDDSLTLFQKLIDK
jgi:hypothetical protein